MLDKTGFKRKRYEDVLLDMEDKAKESYGEKINTTERSPLGILLRIFAWFLSKAWNTAEDVYNSGYISTATGANLDRLGPYVGISRIVEQSATGEVTITGKVGHTEAAGFRVGTSAGLYFETVADFVIGASSTVTVKVKAIEPGQSSNAAAGMVTVIANPNPDVTSVTNSHAITGGREKETDPEFRSRYQLSVAGGGAASVDAIRGALLRLDHVRAAAVIENNTMQVDVAGRPPKSFEVYVLGGDEQEIAETIFKTKSGGIETYGKIMNTVKDVAGYDHIIKFSHAEEIGIQVRIDVTTNERYPADGDEQIKNAIIRYVGGEDAAGSYYNGLIMGASVVYTRLISAVYAVEGVEDVTLTVGKGIDSLKNMNVAIQPFQVAQTKSSRIEVNSHV
ncbi:putative phage protein gp47/JayE [Paenibacillus shirakamiensis]|uniref:Phage protein gp47/JayE n=1 Tax=Paenibacillus shirakamiensis TaxID=1265935 RepID=A0ABS4JLG4_9BACL|nr:baseplate J/gp47 family protein [Paenibacillus shirakamiensis]MBP2002562.1 putative phage protein gp47/JayE [Paenibacillus shirakamiensis]